MRSRSWMIKHHQCTWTLHVVFQLNLECSDCGPISRPHLLTCRIYVGTAFISLHHAKHNGRQWTVMRCLALQWLQLRLWNTGLHGSWRHYLAGWNSFAQHPICRHDSLAFDTDLTAFLETQSLLDIGPEERQDSNRYVQHTCILWR